MRATGLGFRSPKDKSGEFVIPLRKPDGTNMEYGRKSISEKRREMLFKVKAEKGFFKSYNFNDQN
jgi:hypothetical protein